MNGARNVKVVPIHVCAYIIVCHFNVVLLSEIYASIRSKSFYTENSWIKKKAAIQAIWLIDAKYNKVKIQ